jgi:hypothetical protein
LAIFRKKNTFGP